MKVRLTNPAYIQESVVDGPNFRLYIGMQGCIHACKGCFNDCAWSFEGGQEYSVDDVKKVILEASMRHTEGVTFSGGDSLLQPEGVKELSKYAKSLDLSTWLYTGFTWEQILTDTVKVNALQYIDVVVDSPYIENLRNLSIPFRGSSNQRLIDVKKSFEANKLVELNL